MSRVWIALFQFYLLAAVVTSQPDVPKPDTSCSAFAAISILLLRPGHCEGKVEANCMVLEKSRVSKDEVMKTWFTAGVCDDDAQEVAAEDLSDSIGTVWADAIADVNCTDSSFACGWALADPSVWGASFGEMLVEAAEKVIASGQFTGLEKFCPIDLLGAEVNLGDDANEAMAALCQEEGATVEDFHGEYVQTTKDDILTAIKIATSGVCGELSEDSECNPDKEHEAKSIPPCKGSTLRRCCTDRTISHQVCICSRCHNPLKLDTEKEGIVWRDTLGGECNCTATISP